MTRIEPPTRLPVWTYVVIAAGGVLTYWGVGTLLLDNRFVPVGGYLLSILVLAIIALVSSSKGRR